MYHKFYIVYERLKTIFFFSIRRTQNLIPAITQYGYNISTNSGIGI